MGVDSPGDPPDPTCSDPSQPKERPKKRVAEPVIQPTKRADIELDQSSMESIQNIYTHPSMTITDRTYGLNDAGPFIVHVMRIEPDPAAGLTLRPIKIGLLLAKNNISNIVRDGVKAVGRNRVAIEFRNSGDANAFLHHPCLQQNKLNATIPAFHVTRMGLIRGVPKEWSIQQLAEAIELPDNCGIVLKARRLNRKVVSEGTATWVPTQSVVITFRGQVLPKNVYVYYTSMVVEKYLLPTIQCHNCCRFGHTKNQCRSKPRCFRCGQEHSGDSCQDEFQCVLCTGKHVATYKDCPEHQRQHKIKLMMSDNNISYIEASAQVPPARRSYADIAATIFAPSVSEPLVSRNPAAPLPPKSYRKTVLTTPRHRPPPSKGFDRLAHNSITNIPSSPSSNGCALKNQTFSVSNEDLMEILVALLNNCILKPNNNIPNNVAEKIVKLTDIFKSQNGPADPNPTMEY
ncbi:uncharacterized protein [Maniola hyperantus]|uniref:uncharacterized protein n=1 Tax=Aphantopus hyperantus TaxID=2795564 RepID=UPI00374910BB